MRISVCALVVVSLSGCGSSGGGGEDDSVSKFLTLLNSLVGSYATHEVGLTGGGQTRSHGCRRVDRVGSSVRSAVTDIQQTHFCADDGGVEVCAFPGSDSFRVIRTDESAVLEELEIPIRDGISGVETFHQGSSFRYVAVATNPFDCDPESQDPVPSATYVAEDISGNWSGVVTQVGADGVPVTSADGSFDCTESACQGLVEATSIEFDMSNESWSGSLSFGGAQFEMLATVSHGKSVITLLGCPDGVAAEDVMQQCVVVSAARDG